LRLRFIALLAGTGLVFGYWDTLVNRFEKWTRPPAGPAAASAGAESFCPMHPGVVQERPGQCPICGMPLSRRQRGVAETLPEGVVSRVRLAPGRIARAGIRTVEVELGPAVETLTTLGTVGFDESRHVLVSSEARGRARVDRLAVSSEGEQVRAGQRLAEISSYDVSQAIRVYLEAYRALHGPSDERPDPRRTPLGDPEERLRIAAQGLKVLGVRQDQIDAIADGDEPEGLLPLRAPIGGHVIKKDVYQGQYVAEGTTLFEIADLSCVWVHAQVYEDQLARVRVGQAVEAVVPAFPGEVFAGRVALVAPALDPATRTAAVRFDLENPNHRLRPGMFATVTVSVATVTPRSDRADARQATCPVTRLALGSMGPAVRVEVEGRTVWVCCDGCVPKVTSSPGRYLARLDGSASQGVPCVPETAVVDTGTKTLVYVEAEPGVFEGRAVVLGPRSGDRYPVLDGLARGERVAAAGAFLIDAESRLHPATRAAPARQETPAIRNPFSSSKTGF
jgi:Cu(I)/Ag(I) efflux system membrane fusion protein